MTPARARSLAFLARFGVFLVAFYLLIAVHPVNDRVIVPFTAGIAHASAALLNLFGEGVRVSGTAISAGAFAINIENGCNGLEAILLVASAMLAFPARWAQRALGFLGAFAAIEAVNLVRVASLFWIGRHRPAWFSSAHTLVWQSVVVLLGVALFLLWARRVAKETPPVRHVG